MTRDEFLRRLREGLTRLPPEEIENAVSYYTEYLDDAGPENEQQVLSELGDPAKIAQQITAEYMVRDIVATPPKEEKKQPREKKGLHAVWIAVLAVFASPIALPVAIAIAALALALVIVAVALFLSLFLAAIAIVLSGGVGFGMGCAVLLVHPPTGICAIGTGLALMGLGILLFMPVLALCKLTFGGIAKLISRHVMRGKRA